MATTVSIGLVTLILMMIAAGGVMISVTQIRPMEAPNLPFRIPILQKITVAVDCLHALARHGNDRVKPSEIVDYLNDPDNRGRIQHWLSPTQNKEVLIISVGVRKSGRTYWAGYIYGWGRPDRPITMFARPYTQWLHILRRDGYQADPASLAAVRVAGENGLPVYVIGMK